MQAYNKLVMSVLGAVVTVLTMLTGWDVPPEVVTSVGGTITAFLVWLVPNHVPSGLFKE